MKNKIAFTAEELSTEEWKPAVGFDGYEVSNLGRCRSYWRKSGLATVPRINKVFVNNGRAKTSMRIAFRKSTLVVFARVVAETFIGSVKDKLVINADQNPLNCRVSNLAIITYAEYGELRKFQRWIADPENSTIGRRKAAARIRQIQYEKALKIKALRDSGLSYAKIAEQVGMSESGVYRIYAGANNSVLQKALANEQ